MSPVREGSLVLSVPSESDNLDPSVRRGIVSEVTTVGIRVFWDDIGHSGVYAWERLELNLSDPTYRHWTVEVF